MKKLAETTVNSFLDELASESPAPGGGSVAALAGALGAALTSMVCNLTIGKENYQNVQDDMKKILKESEQLRSQLTELIDKDTLAFNEVMKALKMPKETEEQKEKRQQALQAGYKSAALVPLETAKTCEKILNLALVAAQKGNKNSITDAGVSALMAHAGVDSAIFNVKINLGSIKDEKFVEKISFELKELHEKTIEKTQNITNIIESAL
jgi:methenyltetrahydrofolate cyclohydrolase